MRLDRVTVSHCKRMVKLIARFGMAAGYSKEYIARLQLFAQYHDIGKTKVPGELLRKPGVLTSAEMANIKKHSVKGWRLARMMGLGNIANLILHHHERWDGDGYPAGLAGVEIPAECRLLAIVDAYDAMTNARPYRTAIEPPAALEEIQRCAGTQFDPAMVARFVAFMRADKRGGYMRQNNKTSAVKERMKVCMNVAFRGVDGFEKFRPNVEIILCSLDKSSLIKFRLAVNEAICNALRYGEGGIEEARVRLNIRYSGDYIVAKISSESAGFNVRDYVAKLQGVNQAEWWDYLKSKNRGRGLWIMLAGSQKVIFNATGSQVILAMRIKDAAVDKEPLSKVFVLAN